MKIGDNFKIGDTVRVVRGALAKVLGDQNAKIIEIGEVLGTHWGDEQNVLIEFDDGSTARLNIEYLDIVAA